MSTTPKHLAEPNILTQIAENIAKAHCVWFRVPPAGNGRRRK